MKNIFRNYLGYTDGMKPLEQGRKEKTLDKDIRHEGKYMTQKEFILLKHIEGYKAEKEDNYSYYSRRLDDYTKPKTRYMIKNKEGSFFEVSKTEYEFSIYLSENNFDMEKAIQYSTKENEELERKQKEESARLEKKRIERLEKEEAEKTERKERAEKLMNEAIVYGKTLMTDTVKNIVVNAVDQLWNEIEEYNNRGRIEQTKEEFYNKAIESYTLELGRKEQRIAWMADSFHDELNGNRLPNRLEKMIYSQVFGINENDPKITITAKVKAYYNGTEYKGTPKVETETYYIRVVNDGFQERQGEKKTYKGFTFFIEKMDGKYKATEARTGSSITTDNNKSDLLKKTRKLIEEKTDLLGRNIESYIKKFGLSPLYENEKEYQQ